MFLAVEQGKDVNNFTLRLSNFYQLPFIKDDFKFPVATLKGAGTMGNFFVIVLTSVQDVLAVVLDCAPHSLNLFLCSETLEFVGESYLDEVPHLFI